MFSTCSHMSSNSCVGEKTDIRRRDILFPWSICSVGIIRCPSQGKTCICTDIHKVNGSLLYLNVLSIKVHLQLTLYASKWKVLLSQMDQDIKKIHFTFLDNDFCLQKSGSVRWQNKLFSVRLHIYSVLNVLPLLTLTSTFLSFPQYGDYDPNFHKPGFLAQDELLPKRVSFQFCLHIWLSMKLYFPYLRTAVG